MKDHITIVGNVGAPPELRRGPDGVAIASFRVASTDRRRDPKTNEWTDGPTSWYSVSAFRALGENVLASIRRGQRVVVTGTLEIREWESGEKSGTSAQIVADAVGHDLKFATTVATPVRRPDDGGAAAAEEGAVGTVPEHEGELVGAGASGWAPAPGETPY